MEIIFLDIMYIYITTQPILYTSHLSVLSWAQELGRADRDGFTHSSPRYLFEIESENKEYGFQWR